MVRDDSFFFSQVSYLFKNHITAALGGDLESRSDSPPSKTDSAVYTDVAYYGIEL